MCGILYSSGILRVVIFKSVYLPTRSAVTLQRSCGGAFSFVLNRYYLITVN